MDDEERLEAVEEACGYGFRDRGILLDALTHRSYCNENAGCERDNQRLEFLGDAVLELTISALLFRQRPDANEGDLTQLRANLVNTGGLARIADDLGLGAQVRIGVGEERTGGRERPSLRADALEAVIGAVFLDRGFEAAGELVDRLFEARARELELAPETNPKSDLQEWAQQALGITPRYRIVEVRGPEHEATFVAEVSVGPAITGRGAGRSKKTAERRAAREALAQREGLDLVGGEASLDVAALEGVDSPSGHEDAGEVGR